MENDYDSLVKAMKAEKVRQKISYEKLAKLSGCSISTIHHFLTERSNTSYELIERVCQNLGIDIKEYAPKKVKLIMFPKEIWKFKDVFDLRRDQVFTEYEEWYIGYDVLVFEGKLIKQCRNCNDRFIFDVVDGRRAYKERYLKRDGLSVSGYIKHYTIEEARKLSKKEMNR